MKLEDTIKKIKRAVARVALDVPIVIDFGLQDERGRAIGSRVHIYREHISERGVRAQVQPTRNGQGFGATQVFKRYESLAAAKATITEIVIASSKRYRRKYGVSR